VFVSLSVFQAEKTSANYVSYQISKMVSDKNGKRIRWAGLPLQVWQHN